VAGLIAAAATDDGSTQCQATRRAKVGAHIEKAALGESELLGGLRRSGGACDYLREPGNIGFAPQGARMVDEGVRGIGKRRAGGLGYAGRRKTSE
jgi:hypothetical protein